MRIYPRIASAVAIVAAALLSGQPHISGALQKPEPQPIKVQANFVRVDVYPTRDGKPVDDLREEDFEVLEDGTPQVIASFEHVVVRAPAPGSAAAAEPNTVRESVQLAADARSRVFVLFLDLPHVSFEASRDSTGPLLRLLDRLLGPDDLIGVMTPDMRPSDVVLARKTDVLQSFFSERWPWGERLSKTKRERIYEKCYAIYAPERITEMTDRAQERATLESLSGLVEHLRVIREERKAILTVSEGWQLFRPSTTLTDRNANPTTGWGEPVPKVDPITVGPDGKLTTKDTKTADPADRTLCEADRLRLAAIDDARYFKELIDKANRANASFYTIDPRGVAIFDTSLNARSAPPGGPTTASTGRGGIKIITTPGAPTSEGIDALQHRQDTLRTLAANTDGIAVMNTDLDRGLARISNDSTSYYLLGYYSKNTKLDGKFRALKVGVKRPGVDVRARPGYRAATEAEVAATSAAATRPAAPVSPVAAAIASLGSIRPNASLYVAAIPGTAESGTIAVIWVAAEIQAGALAKDWASAGRAEVEMTVQGRVVTTEVTLVPGQRGFVTPVRLPSPMTSGSVSVIVRRAGAPQTERESTRLDLASDAGHPLLFRRGPTTGNRLEPAASGRFMRTERLRLEIPAGAGDRIGTAQLLDRTGKPMALPLAVGERTDAPTGQRWLTADITLAALAAGDYAIELTVVTSAGEQRLVSAFKIVP